MTTDTKISKRVKPTPWYKIPVLWIMFAILGFTVISGLTMLSFAHRTQDGLVVEQGVIPLNKKQGMVQKDVEKEETEKEFEPTSKQDQAKKAKPE